MVACKHGRLACSLLSWHAAEGGGGGAVHAFGISVFVVTLCEFDFVEGTAEGRHGKIDCCRSDCLGDFWIGDRLVMNYNVKIR